MIAPVLLRVELYGVARARAGRGAVEVEVPADAVLGDALERLADAVPGLVGPVIGGDRRSLAPGSLASVDGTRFLRDPGERIPAGRPLLLLPASAGG